MAQTRRSFMPARALLLLAVLAAAVIMLRPQPAAPQLQPSSDFTLQQPNGQAAGDPPAQAPNNPQVGGGAGSGQAATSTSAPLQSLPADVRMQAKGADRQPPAVNGDMP